MFHWLGAKDSDFTQIETKTSPKNKPNVPLRSIVMLKTIKSRPMQANDLASTTITTAIIIIIMSVICFRQADRSISSAPKYPREIVFSCVYHVQYFVEFFTSFI